MKITRYEFEKEMDALLEAAKHAGSRNTALDYLKKAENKISGYDNIPRDLVNAYLLKIEMVRDSI